MRKLMAVLLALAAPAAALAEVTVHQPWVAEAPPAAAVMGGFMELRNAAAEPVELVAVESPQFEWVELHETVHEGDMARMVARDVIEVPAQGAALLEPGGLHLMLMNPRGHYMAGDTLPLTLRFSDGQTLEVRAPVKKRTSGGHHHRDHRHRDQHHRDHHHRH